MPDPIKPELPLPENAFPVENWRTPKTERQAKQNQVPLLKENKDTKSAFPLENSGIVRADRNVRGGMPVEE